MEIIISIKVMEIEIENVDYRLVGVCQKDSIFWGMPGGYPFGEDSKLEIETDIKMEEVKNITIGAKIKTPYDEIKDAALEALFNEYIIQKTDEADGFEHTHDTNEGQPKALDTNPYDPKLIRVDTRPFSIEHICKLIFRKKLDLSPDFQREFVWTEIKRKSRLIESILLRIPIPLFYFAQDETGMYQVVDGVQRLTVINDFVNNKFKLKHLEYLKDLEGLWFRREDSQEKSLPPVYAGRVEETQLFINIIDPATPGAVKYDIFRRINTGGKTLNAQEIRNCLSGIKTRNLLNEMTANNNFLSATKGSIRPTRMADKEIALRFAGFYLLDEGMLDVGYTGNLDDFLDKITDRLNSSTQEEYKAIYNAFDNAMLNAYTLFGDRAFRRSTLINKALFVSFSRELYKIDNSRLCNIRVGKAKAVFDAKCDNDVEYVNSISIGTNDIARMDKASKSAREILEELLND